MTTAASAPATSSTPPNPNSADDLWPSIDDVAYHGLAGDVVRAIKPHSEADPVAILIQLLAYTGNAIGRAPHYLVEGDQHRANLYVVLVGETAKARKGTSAGRVRSIIRYADPIWTEKRNRSGLSTGEGLIDQVRDGDDDDPGAPDKRLLVAEPEFAQALAVMERPGNTLSPVIRAAWDGLTLSTLTRHAPLTATGTHISIVGHITNAELRTRLTRTDLADGFANRFLFVLVRRSKLLPHGGAIGDGDIKLLGERIGTVVEEMRTVDRITMTDDARVKWETIYESLSAARPGLLGAITARAEAQTIRLALIYALLDRSHQIDTSHLRAALAVWEYCEASAIYIYGDALGDPVADDICRALRHAGDAGMNRTAIRDLFGRHQSAGRISAALGLLATSGRARCEPSRTEGRSAEMWFGSAGVRRHTMR
jgi:hypothetical protein